MDRIDRDQQTGIVIGLTLLAIGFALSGCWQPSYAREGWADRPLACNPKELGEGKDLTQCRVWIAGVSQPDVPRSRCCGEGDAFIADSFVVRDDKFFAIITQEYPALTTDDGEGGTVTLTPVPKGTEIEIPKHKFNNAFENGGNPTGHGIVFMNDAKQVYCYFGPNLASRPGSQFASRSD